MFSVTVLPVVVRDVVAEVVVVVLEDSVVLLEGSAVVLAGGVVVLAGGTTVGSIKEWRVMLKEINDHI